MIRCNLKTNEVFLYGVCGNDRLTDCFSSSEVVQALDRLNGAKAVIRINSPGGVADEGIAIYNALKRYPGGVNTYNDAIAASAASVIFLAGSKRFASKGSRVMIHNAMTLTIGNAHELQKMASTLAKYDDSLVEIYGKYLKQSPTEIRHLMENETWFNDHESISAGLATGFEVATTAEPMVAAWFKNAPAALAAKAKVHGMQALRYRNASL